MRNYIVRPMFPSDIPQAVEIEKEAFPTQWPSTPFRQELQNRLARYLVVVEPGQQPPPGPPSPGRGGLLAWLKDRLSPSNPPADRDSILGFAGLWFTVDEAHLINIAVREKARRRGIGELLLLSSLELAQREGGNYMTLEVRGSNESAQALYRKYGFKPSGLRKGYYSDNNEDALVMTTDKITSASFQAHLQALKRAYQERWEREESPSSSHP